MQFDEAVQYLLGLGHETLTIKLGLRNTELLLAALDNPERSYQVVQIAGTNGKGSTAAMLDSICRAVGIRAGLYTSPHLAPVSISYSVLLSPHSHPLQPPSVQFISTTITSPLQASTSSSLLVTWPRSSHALVSGRLDRLLYL